jgi:hypothetical protein
MTTPSCELRIRLRRDGLFWQEVDGEIIALDAKRSDYLSGNAATASLWPMLTEGATPSELARALGERWQLSPRRAQDDADSLIAELWRLELIESVPCSP